MAYSEDIRGWDEYYRLERAVIEVIEAVESGDMNFEAAIDRLKAETDY